MKTIKIAYVPIGVPTFDLEVAQVQFEKSINMLRSIDNNIIIPTKPLLNLIDLNTFIDSNEIDLLILQNLTFANSAYAQEVIKRFQGPIVLWTLEEPVIDGGRLRLNSLTGAYSAANLFHQFGKTDFQYVFGAPDDIKVLETIRRSYKAATIKEKLKHLNVASIGHTPQGFGFGNALDAEVARAFGSTLHFIEARELMMRARELEKADYQDEKDESESKMKGLMLLPDENVDAHHRLYAAYKEYVVNNNIKAVASRCWPDFFTEYGTPVCGVLGMLNDNLVAAACEADLYGAITMFVGMELTGKPVFFGDPVSLNEEENTVTYWHCGTAACSLAREDKGPEMGVHPNRKIGPTMEFGAKPCKEVTLFRIGRKPDGTFRFFISTGEALDKPKQFLGTSVVVRTDSNAKRLVETSVKDGWEPHFAVVYDNISKELEILAEMLHMEICRY